MVMEKLMRKLNTNPAHKKKLSGPSTSSHACTTFGLPLREVIERDRTAIPLVVMDIFDFISSNNGLKAQGLFRVNGNMRTVEMLRNLMDENGAHWRRSELLDLAGESERSIDVFTVASLLKLYLRELPDGLISSMVTPLFLEAFTSNRLDKSACLHHIEQLVAHLPAPNYTLLQHVCYFLHAVWNHRSDNKMSSEALGIVFGPSIFRLGADAEQIHDQGTLNRIMMLLIEKANQIFRMTAPSFSKMFSNPMDRLGPKQPYPDTKVPPRTCPVNNEKQQLTDSASSNSESLSQSTTLGLEHQGMKRLVPRKGGDIPGGYTPTMTSLKPSPTWQPGDFSSGLAAAIRVCIEEHLFGSLQTSVISNRPELSDDESSGGVQPSQLHHDMPTVAHRGKHLPSSQLQDPSWTTHGPETEMGETLSTLAHRLHQVKARLRDHERYFEGAWGHKPSLMEKKADSQIRELMDDLATIRATIKRVKQSHADEYAQPVRITQDKDGGFIRSEPMGNRLKSGPQRLTAIQPIDLYGKSPATPPTRPRASDETVNSRGATGGKGSRVDDAANPNDWDSTQWSGPYSNGSTTTTAAVQTRVGPPTDTSAPSHPTLSGATTLKTDPSISDTYTVLVHRLTEKRNASSRPEALELMSPEQVEAEKLSIQKALLYFESVHGRPRGRQERLVMRPMYDRYRSVKRQLNDLHATGQHVSGMTSSSGSDPNRGGGGGGGGVDVKGSPTSVSPKGDWQDRESLQLEVRHANTRLPLDDYRRSNATIETASGFCNKPSTIDNPPSSTATRSTIKTVPPPFQRTLPQSGLQRSLSESEHPHHMSNRGNSTGWSSGDEQSPARVANNSAEQIVAPSWPATLPRTGHAGSKQNNGSGTGTTATAALFEHPSDPSEMDSEIRTVQNEWFGSFRPTASNRTSSKTIRPQQPPSVSDREDVDADPDPMVRRIRPSVFSRTAPDISVEDCEQTKRRTDQRNSRTTDAAPTRLSEQKLIQNRRMLSSPSDYASVNTISSMNTHPTGNASLAAMNVVELQAELQQVQETKRHLQKTLKDFEHDFQQSTGHKVERADRLCMRVEYNQYKQLKTRLSNLECELNSRTS